MDFRWCAKSSSEPSLAWTDPAPFAPGKTLGEALLTPTRIYVKPVLRVLAETDGVKALAHITGGGSDNLQRVLLKTSCHQGRSIGNSRPRRCLDG